MTFLGYGFYNDVSMLPKYALLAGGYFALLFLSIVLHELGHYFCLRRLGKTPKFELIFKNFSLSGEMTGFDELADYDYLTVLWSGIVVGAMPIIAFSFMFAPLVLLLIPYLVICKSDFKELEKIYTRNGKGFMGMEDD